MNLVPQSPVNNLCVYCGSRLGNDPNFEVAARELGYRLAAHNIGLVYGGGAIGLMGVVASAVAVVSVGIDFGVGGHAALSSCTSFRPSALS